MRRCRITLLQTMPLVTALVFCGCSEGNLKQKVAATDWRWSDEENQLLRCLHAHLSDYEVRVTNPKSEWPPVPLRIEVYDGDAEVYSFEGHDETVLTRIGDVVFVAELSPIATGCAVVAFDLKQRKHLWRTVLKGNPPETHSKYRHQVILARDGNMLVVYGKESNGRYIEFLDAASGKIVGHKTLPRE